MTHRLSLDLKLILLYNTKGEYSRKNNKQIRLFWWTRKIWRNVSE